MKTIVKSPIFQLLAFVFALGAFLSIFRVADKDELIYLEEARMMAASLNQGQWIGNEWVGLHGFLFKIPAALLYLMTGDLILWATLFHVALATLCVGLCFLFLKRVVGTSHFALVGAWLLATSYYFILSSFTFLREIPVLFSLLLFLNLLVYQKNRWWIGLSLVLVLDAKEHVFFQIAPGLFLATLFFYPSLSWRERISHLTAFFLPPLIYLFLMFFTDAIPLNVFTAYILGLEEKGFSKLMRDFSTEKSTNNFWEGGKTIFQFASPAIPLDPMAPTIPGSTGTSSVNDAVEHSAILHTFTNILNWGLAYLGKFLYPRTFSFHSIPFPILIPALIFSAMKFHTWLREKNPFTLLSVMLWSGTVIYFLRVSHGRYLLPMAPLFFLFFVLFLMEAYRGWIHTRKTLVAASVFTASGLLFENNFISIKCLLNTSLLACLWIPHLKNTWLSPLRVGWIFGGSTLCVTLAAVLLFPESQFRKYLRYGKNMEMEKVATQLDLGSKVWTNCHFPHLDVPKMDKRFIMSERFLLKDWVPKKWLMTALSEQNCTLYRFNWKQLGQLKKEIRRLGIGQFGYVTFGEDPASDQCFQDLSRLSCLRLEKTVPLKNKTLHLFRVKNNSP